MAHIDFNYLIFIKIARAMGLRNQVRKLIY